MNHPPAAKSSPRETRLRLVGMVVLVAGLLGAGLVYYLGTRSLDTSDDLSMLRYDQPQQRQMQMLYGKQGRLIQELSDALEKPGAQAMLIVGISVAVAAGCFYFARVPGSASHCASETDT